MENFHQIISGPPLGATWLGDGRCQFHVWAPLAQQVEVHIVAPQERSVPLESAEHGYFQAVVEHVDPGTRYFYRLDGVKERPDPASHFQPVDVHGPSQVIAHDFDWHDQTWPGVLLQDYIIYELHVGTFTSEGTFDAIIPHLDRLKDLGITAIELMPVAQFPGSRNWGYDGVQPFAVQNSYGGPDGLKRLVDACHQRGLAVVLDVVYNHMGPEGNYLWDYGHYFTDLYRTPWGSSLNFDGPYSDEVRRYFIENALYWIETFHIDALRLDAVHAILDFAADTFLEELADGVATCREQANRRVYLIAESDLNNARLIRARELGGYGLDAQWSDDFHHALHTLLTGERDGYYSSFGEVDHLVRVLREGYTYTGQYSPARQRRYGNSTYGIPAFRFVVCAQNHDQIGNRMLGERLSQLTSFEGLKLAAGLVLLSPFVPMLYMGEEYGETAPFLYFISHGDSALVEAVRKGRAEEFASFAWQGTPPDPQAEATFVHSRLDHSLRTQGHHRVLLDFYTELIRLRKTVPTLAALSIEQMDVVGYGQGLFLRRWHANQQIAVVCNFGMQQATFTVPLPAGTWHTRLDSAAEQWQGPGSTLPSTVSSSGSVCLDLAPQSFGLFVDNL